MSKIRESIAFQELLTSAKTNQFIADYITPGKLIMHITGCWYQHATPTYLGWWLYNPNKVIFDRVRLLGQVNDPTGGGTTGDALLQYTLDSGASWASVGAGTDVAGLLITMPADVTNTPPPVELTLRFWDINISSIAATQYFGVRLESAGGGHGMAVIDLAVLMYSSTETPF
jgi:hypothetical protein